MSQWGHDFRADYLQLSLLHEQFPAIPRIALTATADEQTRLEIAARLQLTDAAHFVVGFDRPNIRYRIGLKHNARQQLLAFLKAEHPNDAGIVYCLSRKKTEETASWLATQGLYGPALPRGAPRRGARSASSPLSPRGGHRHGGHHCLWHGHRQTRRALCGAPRSYPRPLSPIIKRPAAPGAMAHPPMPG